MTRVDVKDLIVFETEKVGAGGTAEAVLRCVGPDGPALFKRYDRTQTGVIDIAGLEAVVRWPRRLDTEDAAFLQKRAAWPTWVVTDEQPGALGVLMPEAPTITWRESSGGGRLTRPISHLSVTEASAAEWGNEYFTPPRRMSRLGQLFDLLCFFHRLDVVLGDLHPANVLVSGPSEHPFVYLLDCDSVVIENTFVHPCNDPEDFRYPHGDTFTTASDRYKFALITIQCLQSDLSLVHMEHLELRLLMPSRETTMLEQMHSADGHRVSLQEMQSTARAWSGSYEVDGTDYVRTDEGWRPYDPRRDTLAGRARQRRVRQVLLLLVVLLVVAGGVCGAFLLGAFGSA